MTQTDQLVTDYLARVERAAAGLPAGRREELLADLREHIDIARAESGAETEADIRTILDRLGDPESIVAAADTQTDLPRVPAAPLYAAAPRRRFPWLVLTIVAAVIGTVILFCGFVMFAVRSDGGVDKAPVYPAPTAVEVSPGP
ncbi:hypothetical protein GCM10010112_81160 [Actinoplanes lobatus]|uniref:Putative membrane protein n=1 Tax=Actinoplanes lobatus TaxID=113568 RepID=A0A7W7HFV9_9ACTN|nr:hypothetical protein [Actinoplanes lobatus]MBB4749811.1 putative membrane protein [Actinoplanes lobatus]GGN93199.1 hypothetical protein GCM10010112_81160 [Actinoplanes lobatus]GIE38548.1 hypothetical protein Alo02nite_14460 [Actinoplanes lobatus]